MTCPMTWMAASILNGPLPVHEARARLGVTRTHAVMRPNVLDADEIAEAAVTRAMKQPVTRKPRHDGVSDDARTFILAHYATMTNDAIGGCTGVNPRTVAIIGCRAGLRKTAAHIRAQRLAQHDRAREAKRQQAAARPA